jgi:hypothetical protein
MSLKVLPEQVKIQLVDGSNHPIRMPNVLFGITVFAATQKNDYHLQPFGTDSEGLATITKNQLEAEVAANVSSGLMDYGHISGYSSSVEIRMLTEEEIKRAVKARKTIWRMLLDGERGRWQSVEELLAFYEHANNRRLLALKPAMRVTWSWDTAEYSYNFPVAYRNA